LDNFDTGNEEKQKYVTMNKLWNLKQQRLGGVAEYTIEFRRLIGRLGWPDKVLIDIIRKGLIDRVREEFDKVKKPDTLFKTTNIIIGIDKKCYLESCICNKTGNYNKHKSFNKRRKELNKTENQFKKNKFKKELLSANYTPSGEISMTTTFYLQVNGKNIKANI